jgi:hypothetical protein
MELQQHLRRMLLHFTEIGQDDCLRIAMYDEEDIVVNASDMITLADGVSMTSLALDTAVATVTSILRLREVPNITVNIFVVVGRVSPECSTSTLLHNLFLSGLPLIWLDSNKRRITLSAERRSKLTPTSGLWRQTILKKTNH